MATVPQYMMRRMARRAGGSDVTRLADEYKKRLEQTTANYEKSFSDYQKSRDEQMAPYNAAMDQYRERFGEYQENMTNYRKRLDEYTAKLEDVKNNPKEELKLGVDYRMGESLQTRRFGPPIPRFYIGDTLYTPNNLPDGYEMENEGQPNWGQKVRLFRTRTAGEFTEKPPEAPTSPGEAPKVAEFDSSQFEQQKGQLQSDFKRETAERRASRLNATRRSGRTMLGGQS